MASLAVTVKGQVTLKRDLLQHLGIEPGEPLNLKSCPAANYASARHDQAARLTGFFMLWMAR
ncbi:MAG TPA: AbrB/MazE/SpoVT family DNA-binding domain-containing protein [Acetobacteraceae bacterium]|nr:AbrB/MazE/SpoVT family DNA-binding domain-containing protein [Acetobacteraceae bacterium]